MRTVWWLLEFCSGMLLLEWLKLLSIGMPHHCWGNCWSAFTNNFKYTVTLYLNIRCRVVIRSGKAVETHWLSDHFAPAAFVNCDQLKTENKYFLTDSNIIVWLTKVINCNKYVTRCWKSHLSFKFQIFLLQEHAPGSPPPF